MKLTSVAFEDRGQIPEKYSCNGDNPTSPPLAIDDVPPNAASLVLLVDDPDAPGPIFHHWVVWNISPSVATIGEGLPPRGVQGQNSLKKVGWTPPCPPNGEHRYIFTLYALDTMLTLPEDSAHDDVREAMQGHVVGRTELIGLYGGSK